MMHIPFLFEKCMTYLISGPKMVQFCHRNLSIFMQKIIYRDCTQISLSLLIDFTIISLHPQCSREQSIKVQLIFPHIFVVYKKASENEFSKSTRQILGSSANNLEGKREEGKRGRRALTESGKRGRRQGRG
jgi:hypothetical protein